MYLRILSLLGLVVLLTACDTAPNEKIIRFSGQTMGTTYHVSWVGIDESKNSSLKEQVDQRLVAINKAMSTYDPSSELSFINKNQAPKTLKGEITLSADLAEVLDISLQVWQASQGAFDVTIGPLVNLWGFGPEAKPNKIPTEQEINERLQNIGSQNLQLDLANQQLVLTGQQYIDLSAVAKGWAVDEIAKVIENQGVHSYLVEIGGEVTAKGRKPANQPWRIAIEKPQELVAQSAMLIIDLDELSVATSGDYRNYFEEEGVRYSHTIDPRTGYPIKHNLASVTVVHPSTGFADAWATAITVAGAEQGLILAEQNNLMVYMQVGEGKGFKELYSSAFKRQFPQVGGK